MSDQPDYEAINRRLWEDWTAIHVDSAFYDVAGFRIGRSSLHAIERSQLGNVHGKRLLHLQCHFGMDTISWAREGARVTGVDFSPRAIEVARELAADVGVDTRFIESSVYALPEVLDETFDIVFTSWGVLPWLPDIRRWADVASRYVAPGGSLHVVEFHPIADVLDESGHDFAYRYFADEPIVETAEGSYADRDAGGSREEVTFAHTLGDIVTAVADSGLVVRRLQEFPFSPAGLAPWLEQEAPGRWVQRDAKGALPLSWALHADRPASPEPPPAGTV